MRLCFVVHRYAPFPGGSEYYVQWMAEECHTRGHKVTVFTGEHQGDLNGVEVTSDGAIFTDDDPFDLIIVHGGDVFVQNAVLSAIPRLAAPVLYLIIKPSDTPVCQFAMNHAQFVGCSTEEDWDHVRKYHAESRAVSVRHGIHSSKRRGIPGLFRSKYHIPDRYRLFLSCGGYWPNKQMKELAQVFEQANLDQAVLVTTGYDNRMDIMPAETPRVIPLILENECDVANALVDADVYLMHSSEEGFGLVLLECMLNKTPWIARHIAGARLLWPHGKTYTTDAELITLLQTYNFSHNQIDKAYHYVREHHLIQHTVDDIEKILHTLK